MELVQDFNALLDNFRSVMKFRDMKIVSESDISSLPLTYRKDLEEFKFEDCPVRPESVNTTSGSSGKNVFIYYSKEANKNIVNRGKNFFRILGINESDIFLNLFEYGLSNAGRIVDYICTTQGVSVIPFGVPVKEKINVTVEAINNINPTILLATYSIVHEIFSHDINIRFKKVLCAGSMATPKFVDNIQKMSKSPVHNVYGCNEIGFISTNENCEDEYMELAEEGLYIEIMNENKKFSRVGEGKIVITDLHNYSMPFIRYVLGDIVNIKEENGKKYIKVLGRGDNFTNINDSVFSVGMMLKFCMDTIGHDKFSIMVDQDVDTHKDKIVIGLRQEDLEKKENLVKEFNKVGLYPRVIKLAKILYTSSGKVINYVDKRKRLLEKKNLNF